MKKLLAMIVATVAAGVIRPAFAATVDLSHVTGDTMLNNGDIATGTFGGSCKISVADGAMVTLRNAVMTNSTDWACVNCIGNATIVLEGENTLYPVGSYYSAIHVPVNKTLTIQGSGSLEARGGTDSAAIGSGGQIDCGNIVIAGGTITATGAPFASRIGSGAGSVCGNITISGGNVTAIGSTAWGNGIGAGYGGTCGDILISGGTVYAEGGVHGSGIGSSISPGLDTTCGNITISGGNVTAISGEAAAAIGSSSGNASDINPGRSVCGDITISGGIVNATVLPTAKNAYDCIGIGPGFINASCGNITIGPGIIRVTATCCTKDQGCVPIGANKETYSNVICGTVTIDPSLSDETHETAAITANPDIVTLTRTIEPRIVNLAAITGDATAANGYTITGTLASNCKITITDGATVTLSNASINAGAALADSTPWAGLTCEGDATIVLEGENTVKAFYNRYAGIQFPSGKTLTICGSGSLVAVSGGMAAGIGAGYSTGSACGDIVIDGGVIIASGGSYGTGIGTGWGSGADCGNITIRGGDVTAQGGQHAAGIGSSYSRTCGDITITKGIARVVATCGANCENPIGAGNGGTSGTVTVATGLSDDRGSPTRTIEVAASGYPAWAADNGITGAWNDKDAYRIYNVFRYAFDRPAGDFAIIGITFNEAGKAVVVTPPLVNGEGFALSVVASDNVTGTGNVAETPLSVSGETTINETGKAKRFFRLKATEAE